MNRNVKFIFVKQVTGKIMYGSVFNDFECDKRVIVTENLRKVNSPVLRFIRKLHLSKKVNSLVNLPFKKVWSGAFEGISFDKTKKYIVIFTNASFAPLTPKYLISLQKKYNIEYVLFLHDVMGTKPCKDGEFFIERMNFDYIFSFNKGDALKYNFHYSFLPYSLFHANRDSVSIDLYYAGNAINILDKLHNLYIDSVKHEATAMFRLTRVKRREKKRNTNIIYNERIPYCEVIKEMIRSNCILEYIRYSEQTDSTLRYYEAVCYNKKLLTNNKNVVNLPFYNPDYIHVFEKPEDIDWDWVKKRIHVDYHYDGRFSPTHLIDNIIELEEEKERKQNAEKETS